MAHQSLRFDEVVAGGGMDVSRKGLTGRVAPHPCSIETGGAGRGLQNEMRLAPAKRLVRTFRRPENKHVGSWRRPKGDEVIGDGSTDSRVQRNPSRSDAFGVLAVSAFQVLASNRQLFRDLPPGGQELVATNDE